jgi:hypothetical protein
VPHLVPRSPRAADWRKPMGLIHCLSSCAFGSASLYGTGSMQCQTMQHREQGVIPYCIVSCALVSAVGVHGAGVEAAQGIRGKQRSWRQQQRTIVPGQ